MAYPEHEHQREDAPDEIETDDGWVTVKEAAEQVGRSVDWVRRQYRSGVVESRTQAGRYGPERLVDIHALGAVAEARKAAPPAPPSAPLPVLAETLHELVRQLGEVQDRAARAEADAEELRHRLADAEQATTGPEPPEASPDAEVPERHASLWLAANRQFLRTLPGAAAREAAGARLAGRRPVEPAPRTRPWRRWRAD